MVESLVRSVPTSRPVLAFLLILLAIFTVEAAVMVLLPLFMPSDAHVFVAPLVDAFMLTTLVSPIVWHFIVRPLRRIAGLRAQVLDYVLTAQEEERRRLARDLHDEIGQALTTLLVGLRTLEESGNLDDAKERARQLRQLGSATHDEIRRLARGLRPTVLDDLGLHAALERMAEEFAQMHGIVVTVDAPQITTERLPNAVETALFRIVQESLTNIAKHARARQVGIQIQRLPATVEATIQDDGCGFDADLHDGLPASKNSIGLSSMRERAILLGGDVSVRSQPGKGTVVRVSVPLTETARGENSSFAGG